MPGDFTSHREFTVALDRFKGLVRDQFVTAQKVVTLDLLSQLQTGNPVRTGRSRSGWTASAGSPSSRLPFDPGYVQDRDLPRIRAAFEVSAAAALGAARLLQIRFGEASFVVSNVEYVGHVNDRHPRRAGFFEAAIENVTTRYELGAAT